MNFHPALAHLEWGSGESTKALGDSSDANSSSSLLPKSNCRCPVCFACRSKKRALDPLLEAQTVQLISGVTVRLPSHHARVKAAAGRRTRRYLTVQQAVVQENDVFYGDAWSSINKKPRRVTQAGFRSANRQLALGQR